MEHGRKAHVAIIGWACTALCLVSCAAAFSHGASPSACTDMMPQHMRAQLHSPRNNYVTIHTNMSFFPGNKVPVTVRSSRDFMGFLLQARKVSNDEVAGTFVFIPPGSKLLTCFEDGDTVTHSDKSLKRNLSFVWKAPDQPIGDIKFFISVVQSYFVYWAKIESATVAQQVQNKTSADGRKAAKPLTPAPLQGFTDPQVAGMASKGATSPAAVTSSPQPAHTLPGGLAATPAAQALRPGFGVRTEAQPLADPRLQSRALLDATALAVSSSSGRSSNFSAQGLEPSLAFQEPGLTSTWPSFLLQDYSTSYSPYDRTQSIASATKTHLCVTCTGGGQMTTANWAVRKTSLYTTASRSAPHVYTGLLETAVATAQTGDWDSASNLSSASRQMALQPEEAGPSGQEEEEASEEVAGNTSALVTRPAPESAAPGKGRDSGRGTRLIAAQLGILLVCTAVLGLALAAGLRCVCAQHCHKRTEVTFSEPDTAVIAMRESGEMLHFRRIRSNSFVLVQAEYNWVSPSGSGKKGII